MPRTKGWQVSTSRIHRLLYFSHVFLRISVKKTTKAFIVLKQTKGSICFPLRTRGVLVFASKTLRHLFLSQNVFSSISILVTNLHYLQSRAKVLGFKVIRRSLSSNLPQGHRSFGSSSEKDGSTAVRFTFIRGENIRLLWSPNRARKSSVLAEGSAQSSKSVDPLMKPDNKGSSLISTQTSLQFITLRMARRSQYSLKSSLKHRSLLTTNETRDQAISYTSTQTIQAFSTFRMAWRASVLVEGSAQAFLLRTWRLLTHYWSKITKLFHLHLHKQLGLLPPSEWHEGLKVNDSCCRLCSVYP